MLKLSPISTLRQLTDDDLREWLDKNRKLWEDIMDGNYTTYSIYMILLLFYYA